MKRKNELVIIEYGIIVLFFVIGCILFVYLKTAGINTKLSGLSFTLKEIYFKASLGGILIGFKLLFIESKTIPFLSRYFVFWKRRLIWIFLVVLAITMTGLEINLVYVIVFEGYGIKSGLELAMEEVTSGVFSSFVVHSFFLSVVMSFVRMLRLNFGETVFLNYLKGKYSNPLVEHRVFMFMDLNNSTRIAEVLGHVKYSRFLNKCFNDILESLETFNYEIYQFVGDEIVFTWKTKNEGEGNAVKMFHKVQTELNKKRHQYIHHFGFLPSFKASVSCGEVTATLVGQKQKNVAYHGDVLNTTARLLGHCKLLNTNFLCTDFYVSAIKKGSDKDFKFLKQIKLRGKNNRSNVYGAELILQSKLEY